VVQFRAVDDEASFRQSACEHLVVSLNRWRGAQSRVGSHRSDQFAPQA